MAAVVISSIPVTADISIKSPGPGLEIDVYALDNSSGGSDNIARWNLSVWADGKNLTDVTLSLNETDPYYAPNITKLSNYTFSNNSFDLTEGQENAENVTLTMIIKPGTEAGYYKIKIDGDSLWEGWLHESTSIVCTVNVTETIVAPTVIKPNGGEVIAGGSLYTIQWVLPDLTGDIITIYLSTDSGSSWSQIATGEANDGVYSWSVPNIGSSNCLVKVEADKDLIYFATDTSDSTFTITYTSPPPAPPPVAVPEYNAIGLLALIGILTIILAFTTSRRKKE